MAVPTYNVRTLAVKGNNGYGRAECVLAKVRQLGCNLIGLQETRRSGKTEFSAAGYRVLCSGKKKRKAGKDCTELVWQSRNRHPVSLFIPTS